MKKSRRDLLKGMVATTALAPLAACTTLDRWFMGESSDEGEAVVIIGAGLAGLSAAFQLKKNQAPFRIFEGSTRIGGRVMTIRDLNVSTQYGDLGGERIEPDHTAIQNLAAEMKVSLREVNTKESLAWFEKGKFLNERDWKKESSNLISLFQKIQVEAYGTTPQVLNLQNRDHFPKAALLDRMSVSGLLERLQPQMQPWMRPFLEQLVRSEWGVEPTQLSALHLVHWMRDSFRPFGKKYFSLTGGSSVLTQALFDRVSGVIPDRFVRFQHQLTEIREYETGWILIFRTPQGRVEIKTNKIICTLPPNLLREVRGWEKIPVSEERKKLVSELELARHSKLLLSFQERFWADSSVIGNGGTWYTDMPTSSISQAGQSDVEGVTALHGVLQAQLGGQTGENAGPHSVQQMLKDLGKMTDEPIAFENISYVQNWKLFPWSKGSRSFLKPGQFQKFDLKPDTGAWILAGEAHSLPSFGTMNGAVQTGIDAANRFLKTSG